jgi:hypothetical protein
MPRERAPGLTDLWVMLRPAEAYPYLRKLPAEATRWTAIRRPLLIAAVLGCAMSLLTEGRITLRLALPAAVYWSFIPLLQMACVVVSYRRARPEVSLARAIDLSFAGTAPWMLWLLAYTSVWVLLPPSRAYRMANYHGIWYGLAWLAAIWSAYIDFWYFRMVFGKTPAWASGAILLQRGVCWSVGLVVFVWSAGWQTVAGWLGL